MTPENRILRDLTSGQSTADSLAPRVGLPTAAAEIILKRLVAEQKLTTHALGGILASIPVYRLANLPS